MCRGHEMVSTDKPMTGDVLCGRRERAILAPKSLSCHRATVIATDSLRLRRSPMHGAAHTAMSHLLAGKSRAKCRRRNLGEASRRAEWRRKIYASCTSAVAAFLDADYQVCIMAEYDMARSPRQKKLHRCSTATDATIAASNHFPAAGT